MTKPRYNQNINVTIQSLGINGEGVGYWHGYTIFADGALPGEEVRGRLTQVERKFGRIQVSSTLNENPGRTKPPCPLFGRCGGCQLMHLSYDHQIDLKRQLVLKALERVGKLTDIAVEPCIASPSPLHYRNKIQLPVTASDEGLKIGLYARNSHDLIEVDHCLVHCELGETVFQKVSKIIKESGITSYNHATHTGVLRFVLIKSAINTKEVLVTLVTAFEAPEVLKQISDSIMQQCPEVKGVSLNINEAQGNVVLGGNFKLLNGRDFIEEVLAGLTFRVSPSSFFQVNTAQAENLYAKALEFAALTGKENVLDAFCGVGTLSLLIAQQAKHVVGVECVPEAISDAIVNAKRNAIENTEFICANAEDYISTINAIDVAFLNPPRKGCEKQFLEKLTELNPKRIVYISCDPGTLARDLALLREKGYNIVVIQPFDMFPQTSHVECVALLEGQF